MPGLVYTTVLDNNDRHCLVGLLTDLHMLLFLSLFLLSFTTLPTIPVVDQFFMNIGNFIIPRSAPEILSSTENVGGCCSQAASNHRLTGIIPGTVYFLR